MMKKKAGNDKNIMTGEPVIRIFPTMDRLARAFAADLSSKINAEVQKHKIFNIALSGGNTPRIIFDELADHYSGAIPWKNVHLFWGDERCVPSTHPDSNYKMAWQHLIDRINIPGANIHRIVGEAKPEAEATRYSREISDFTRSRNGWPELDMILLGVGEDGHTASIFPNQMELLHSDRICAVSVHPQTGQKRITITGEVIHMARSVVFLVGGNNKAGVIKSILQHEASAGGYPAAKVAEKAGNVEWYLDKEAAGLLDDRTNST